MDMLDGEPENKRPRSSVPIQDVDIESKEESTVSSLDEVAASPKPDQFLSDQYDPHDINIDHYLRWGVFDSLRYLYSEEDQIAYTTAILIFGEYGVGGLSKTYQVLYGQNIPFDHLMFARGLDILTAQGFLDSDGAKIIVFSNTISSDLSIYPHPNTY